MAKFIGCTGDLVLADFERITFGDGADANLWWDGTANELALDSTISGVDPTQSYHLTTKNYVDNEIATLSGSIVLDHGNLTGLEDDDHLQYVPRTGVRGFTGTVSGIDPTASYHLTTRWYVDDAIATLSGSIPYSHGDLLNLDQDDHPHYILVDGSRGFTGTVSGISPTSPNHLTTKQYVDSIAQNLVWQEPVINIVPAASGIATTGNRYIASEDGGGWTEDYIYEYTGTAWSGTAPIEGFAAWVEDLDYLMVYNGTQWVRFGSTVTHNYLNGLQGGTTDEYYHMTNAQHAALTSEGGIVNASTQHIHDDRYYTETEIDTTLSGYALVNHTHPSTDITDFNEAVEDIIGSSVQGASFISVTYNDTTGITTISGVVSSIDHGQLSGLGDDDHLQYVPTNGSRGFTSTVSGIDPVQDYHLATKSYVDNIGLTVSGTIDRHGRYSIGNDTCTFTVNFADLGHTDYTVNATLENTSDSPPSIYAFIVSARTTSSFDITLMGDTDSANYVLNWTVIED